ncbi:MAG: Ig-like domain-containing protein [Rhizobacter sp.]|nr:Ig-like domain-containing protein [Chlorobiales bacterium]
MNMPSLRFAARLVATLCLSLFALRCGGQNENQFPPFEEGQLGSLTTATADSVSSETLGVVAASPQGDLNSITESQTISVTFNQPVVEINDETQMESTRGDLKITSDPKDGASASKKGEELKGTYRWLGSRTLIFTPNDTLPYASTYTAKVSAGLKSFSGQSLTSDYSFTFNTPGPQIIRTYPTGTYTELGLQDELILRFNQKANPNFLSNISVADSKGNAANFTARTVTADEIKKMVDENEKKQGGYEQNYILRYGAAENLLFLKPQSKLTPGETYTLTHNHPKDKYSFTFAPYKVFDYKSKTELSVSADEGFSLEFTNSLSRADLIKNLSITPKVDIPKAENNSDYGSRAHYFSLDLKPSTTYTLTVSQNLTDRFGNKLGKDVRITIKALDYDPQASIPQGYGVVENDFGTADSNVFSHIPVRSINTGAITLESAVLTPEQFLKAKENGNFWNGSEGTTGLNFTSHRIAGGPKKNKGSVSRFNLNETLGGGKSGLVFLQLRRTWPTRTDDEYNRFQKAFIQVTSLGVTAKFARGGSLVFVTTLKDAKPAAGASVSIYVGSRKVWSGTTNQNGIANVPSYETIGAGYASSEDNLYAFAEKDGQIAYTSNSYESGIQPYRFDLDYQPSYTPTTLRARIYTERGLYRAGETVFFKGVVKELRGSRWVVAAKRTFDLTIRNSRYEEVSKKTITVDGDFGSFADSLAVKSNAALGEYSMNLSQPFGGEDERSIATESFRVEAYRPATFATTVKSLTPNVYVGDKFEGIVEGRYLFGAAMVGDKVNWSLTRKARASFEVDGYDGYFWQQLAWNRNETDRSGDDFGAGSGELDNNGQFKVSLGLKTPITEPSTLTLEGEVTDASRQTVAGRASVLLHPAEFYIGLKPATTFIKEGTALGIDVVAMTPEKKLRSESVTVEVVKRQWVSVRQAGAGGRYEWVSQQIDTTVFTEKVSTATDKAVPKSFTPKSAGLYFIRGEAKDSKGNTARSEAYLYVYGKSYVAWERSDDDRLEITPSKNRYKPGETATLMIQSPYETATCLMTIEREGIIEQKTFELKGTAPSVQIPITAEHLPNVYVSLMLIKGRTGVPGKDEQDLAKPSFKIGYVKLSVDAGTKHLQASVKTNKAEYQNGETVEVDIELKNAAGQGVAGEVVLAAVDAGVLNLINYQLPDLFDDFYSERPLGVSTSQSLINLISQRNYGEKGEARGGGGGGSAGGMDVRSKFVSTAYWNPRVITDANGRAKVKFKLPDNLTTFRIMAAAQTKDASFGMAKTDIVVNKPLTMLAALPRFVRIGDVFEAGVVVSNYTKAKTTVKVNANVVGMKLIGEPSSSVSLEGGDTREVRFKFETQGRGIATFKFSATTDAGNSDALEQKIPVQVPYTKETLAMFGSTETKSVERVKIPNNIYAGLGGFTAQASSTALVGLREATAYLFEYPYGCLEQKSSRILPIVLAGDLIESFDLDTFGKTKADTKRVIEQTLGEFEKYQTSGGGFSYWPGSPYPYDYVSIYATYTLTKSAAKGYAINRDVLNRGLEYLKTILRKTDETTYGAYTLELDKSYSLYVLALNNQFDNSTAELLYQNKNRLSLDAKVYLLKAFAVQGKSAARVQTLGGEILNLIKVENATAHFEDGKEEDYIWSFGSAVKTTATVFQGLMEANVNLPMADKITAWLLGTQKNGRWRTTQENIFVLDALNTYFNKYETVVPDFRAKISFASQTLLEETFKGRSLTPVVKQTAMDKLTVKSGDIAIEKSGAGKLFYGLRLSYFPTYAVGPRDNGISVMKMISPLDGGSTRSLRTIKAGDLVRVTLRVAVSQERNFFALDDPLPAGFEAVNPTLATSTSRNVDAGGEGEMSEGEGDGEYAPPRGYEFDHIELKDDRVTLFAERLGTGLHTYSYLARATTYGTFTLPPTYGEEMYRPEVFGRTATQRIVIGEKTVASK